MSLIGDALRKARQEAAERDSDRKGILFSAKIADSPSRSNLGLGLALGALIAVVATVAGGTAVWWILGIGDADPDQGQRSATAAIAQPATESASESEGVPETVGGAFMPRDPEATEPRVVNDPPADDEGPASVRDGSESSSDQRQRSAAATTTEAETASAPASAPDSNPATGFIGEEDGEEIYILEADLGDVSLSLDFLIYREVDPFAEINGVELHLGGTIEGYRVKDIERDRVTLSNGRRTVVLRAP